MKTLDLALMLPLVLFMAGNLLGHCGLRLKTQEDDLGGTAESALRIGGTRATHHVIAVFREESEAKRR